MQLYCLKLIAYGATGVFPKNKNNTNSFAQFIGQYWDSVDLTEFQTLFFEDLIGWRPTKTIGPDHLPPGVESMLDIEYLSSVSGGVPMTVFSTSTTHGGQEPFLEFVKTVLGLTDIPDVISVSYGDVEASLTAKYLLSVDAEFAKIGLRGVTIAFAAGDRFEFFSFFNF